MPIHAALPVRAALALAAGLILTPALAQDEDGGGYAGAYATMQEHFQNNGSETSTILNGDETVVNPETGERPTVGYLPGDTTTDSSGWTYTPDASGGGITATSPDGGTSVETEPADPNAGE